jgi:hypothetical protein
VFFYDARLRAAAGTADPHRKLELLGDALADTPARDDARIPAFHRAAALNQNEYALAIIEQLLRQQHLLRAPVRDTNEEEEIISADETQADAGNHVADSSRPVIASGELSPLEQAHLVRSVGEVMTELNRLDEALPYLQLAQKLERAPARVKEIQSEIAKVRMRLRRQHLNAARQPILHADLEQDRVVRPRLVAQAAPAARANSKASEKP